MIDILAFTLLWFLGVALSFYIGLDYAEQLRSRDKSDR